MCSVTDIINRTIPLSMFNDGKAEEVFDEVQRSGTIVVMKNGYAKCVVMSANDSLQMSDEYNDFKLLRWKNFERSKPGTIQNSINHKNSLLPDCTERGILPDYLMNLS